MVIIRRRVLLLFVLFLLPAGIVHGAINELNGQRGQTQFFANDSNIMINSLNNIHHLVWGGTLSVLRGGTGSSSFLPGSVLFSDGIRIIENNANLFWDNVNARLGVGTATPAARLHVSGGNAIIDGSLGIGTTNPQSTLQVAGNYIQFPTVAGGPPPAADCDSPQELGRVVVGTNGSVNLYVCVEKNINDDPTADMLSGSGLVACADGIASVVDDSTATLAFQVYSNGVGSYLKIDLGPGNAIPYARARLNLESVNLAFYDIRYSDDDTTYFNAVTGFNVQSAGWNEATWPSAGAHRFWRFAVSSAPGTGGPCVRELEMYRESGGPAWTGK